MDHDVLYRGTRPEARIASAQAAATLGASPRPRNPAAVSIPASAAMPERLAQKQTLTGYPSSTNATIGVRYGISLAVHPEKWWSSNRMSSMRTAPQGRAIRSGNVNAGPESTLPSTSDVYRSACTGASRKSDTRGSRRARQPSSSATSRGTSALTAHAQLALPRISENSGPGPGSGPRVPRMRPASSSRYRVRRWRSGELTAGSGIRRTVAELRHGVPATLQATRSESDPMILSGRTAVPSGSPSRRASTHTA